jgi:hypothetical protein
MREALIMTTEVFPVIDCSNVRKYFELAGIPIVDIPKMRGNLNYVEGVCNGSVKFNITFSGDDKIRIQAGNVIKYLNSNIKL